MNYHNYIFKLAGYPAIFSARYPIAYPASKIRYPVGYRISKKTGLSSWLSRALTHHPHRLCCGRIIVIRLRDGKIVLLRLRPLYNNTS
jgi:hypothetical protein